MNAKADTIEFKVEAPQLDIEDTNPQAADPALEESADSKLNEEPKTDDTEVKKLNNDRREALGKLSQAIDILLDSEDKVAVLETLKANPALFSEAKRRYPKKLKAIEDAVTTEEPEKQSPFQKVANLAEQEILIERIITDKTFKAETQLADDEFDEVKETADAIMSINPSMNRQKALRLAVNTVAPDKAHVSTRKSTENPRGEGAAGINDTLAKYRDMGLQGDEAILAADLEKRGAKVSNDNGQFSISL